MASGVGTVTFDLVATDTNNGGNSREYSSRVTYTITVSNPPTANNVRTALLPSNADATSISALSATPATGTSVTSYALKTLPTGGKLYLNTTEITATRSLTATEAGQLNFDPTGTRFGDFAFTYTAINSDGLESTNTATYTIPVANVPPVAVNDPIVTVARNQSASISVLVNDTDIDRDANGVGGIAASTVDLDPDQVGIQQTRTLTNQGAFTVGSTGIVTFVPVNNYAGITTITYTVQDVQGLTSNRASIKVEVKNVTTAYDDSNEVEKGTTVSGNVILNDIDPNNTGFNVTLVAGKGVTHGTLTLNLNGSYTYTPTAGYIGTDSFTYQACDKGTPAQCSSATVYLNVYDPAVQCIAATGPNQLVNPSFADGNIGFNTNYEYKEDLPNVNNELVPETTYGVGYNANNYHNAFRGYGRGGSATVNNNYMMINASSAIRTLYTQTFKVQPNRYYTFSAYFNNLLPPGSNSKEPEVGFVINGQSTSGTLVIKESPDEWVNYSDVWYSGDNTTATFEIRNLTLDAGGNDIGIDDLYFGTCNAVPVANNTVTGAIPSSTTTATAVVPMDATDSDGSIISYTIKSLPAFGTLYVDGVAATVNKSYSTTENGKLTYAPASGRNGNFLFTFQVTDNSGSLSNEATYTIPVGNTAPLAQNVTTSPAISNTAAATSINPLRATDGDGTITSYVITSVPNSTHGTLYIGAARVTTPQVVQPSQLTQLTFDPTGLYAGNTTFTYYAIDNDGNQSNTAIYTIPISNELPVAQNKTATGLRNTNGSTPLSPLVATDADGTIASYTVATLPTSGALTLNGVSVALNQTIRPEQASELSYAPAKSATGNFNFTYYATDNLGGVSNMATYTLPIGGPLPVELVGFEAKAVGNSAQLNWTTATELRNDRFEVERSSTGEAFVTVGTVKGKGTTNTGVAYRFTDANVRNRVSGTVYYRLKQVDTDGTTSYSVVRTVKFSQQEAAISVAPNPATTEAMLDLTALPVGQYHVSVFDATGRTVYSATRSGGEQLPLALNTWPSGIYLVVVQGEAGKFMQRVVKQ
ncbi:Ig-like domain-containing protein [Hymenobacter fodinae]|uniref:Ig-like domain-containing protein n=1 Tax=Hymenobacter fodinae TaxID=2510796 RepID=UPI00143695B8|nr:tandem-95 repeat protein [Hymenobacter fodinae]